MNIILFKITQSGPRWKTIQTVIWMEIHTLQFLFKKDRLSIQRIDLMERRGYPSIDNYIS